MAVDGKTMANTHVGINTLLNILFDLFFRTSVQIQTTLGNVYWLYSGFDFVRNK